MATDRFGRAKELFSGISAKDKKLRFEGTRTEEMLGMNQDSAAIKAHRDYENMPEGMPKAPKPRKR